MSSFVCWKLKALKIWDFVSVAAKKQQPDLKEYVKICRLIVKKVFRWNNKMLIVFCFLFFVFFKPGCKNWTTDVVLVAECLETIQRFWMIQNLFRLFLWLSCVLVWYKILILFLKSGSISVPKFLTGPPRFFCPGRAKFSAASGRGLKCFGAR